MRHPQPTPSCFEVLQLCNWLSFTFLGHKTSIHFVDVLYKGIVRYIDSYRESIEFVYAK